MEPWNKPQRPELIYETNRIILMRVRGFMPRKSIERYLRVAIITPAGIIMIISTSLLFLIPCIHCQQEAYYCCPGKKLVIFHLDPSLSVSLFRFVMLWSPKAIVEPLCNMAPVAGAMVPRRPRPISPKLNPTTNL